MASLTATIATVIATASMNTCIESLISARLLLTIPPTTSNTPIDSANASARISLCSLALYDAECVNQPKYVNPINYLNHVWALI
ncbi:MAG: hypothetical protein QW572_07070 [Candidatus Nitrosocaldus sp.]